MPPSRPSAPWIACCPRSDAGEARVLRGHALFEPGRRQAPARLLRAGERHAVQGRRDVGAARRQRHRVRARLFADPRRSAGDGRRRPAPRQTQLPQAVRRGDGDPGRRRPAGAGLRGAGRTRPRTAIRRCGRRWSSELAKAAGAQGMVGGQMLDLLAETAARHVDRRDHPPAAPEDRRADLVLLHGGGDPGQGGRAAARRRSRPMRTISAWPSRSSTTCSTSRATRPSSARRPGKDADAGQGHLRVDPRPGARPVAGCTTGATGRRSSRAFRRGRPTCCDRRPNSW